MTGPQDSKDDIRDDDALAAEYVLRLLTLAEHQAFDARLRHDSALQARVHDWEARLAPLAETIPPVPPPAAVKATILHAVGATPQPRRNRFARWPIWLGAMTACALIAGLALTVTLRDPSAPLPAYQTELTGPDQTLVLRAGVFPESQEILIEQQSGAAPDGRVLELWLIAEGASAPVSLGVLAASGTTRLRVSDALAPLLVSGVIAVSDEPPGGSPTGAPTGTVLATGTFGDA
ncbi:anti-sigma-K factor rskA [Tritonibacter horizontis]|uniref:Anti-sigma-K factor rskA n=2 Tax=Tritonibacter horizontis TaxID=1768241 RepID=A0A132BV41_9RHOB|nr:anti-sigma-K factor rskA [Tritonibacter horizontis]